MEKGKIYQNRKNKWVLIVDIIDLGALGKAPNQMQFETKKDAEKWWGENKQQFN